MKIVFLKEKEFDKRYTIYRNRTTNFHNEIINVGISMDIAVCVDSKPYIGYTVHQYGFSYFLWVIQCLTFVDLQRFFVKNTYVIEGNVTEYTFIKKDMIYKFEISSMEIAFDTQPIDLCKFYTRFLSHQFKQKGIK